MDNANKFYINGSWVDPSGSETLEVINPSTEEPICSIAMGTATDVDTAAAAAKAAFPAFSATSPEERSELLDRIMAAYGARMEDLANTVSSEMGAPMALASAAQAPSGFGHLMFAKAALDAFEWEETVGTSQVVYEAMGVCAFITPWNWPLNQIAAKVAPAIAAGCTMVLKPSEIAPLNAVIFAEIMDAAGVPAGVFNLIHGDGPNVGVAMSSHPDVDMVSFTGSTRAGISVAQNAAPTVKRVAQELGGKSANIICDDVDFDAVISRDLFGMCQNSGQSCNAGSRMLVPNNKMDKVLEIAAATAAKITTGNAAAEGTRMGPVVSKAQYDKIQGLIQAGIDEGATLVCGGVGRPVGLDHGYFVQPTVFGNVTNDMRIAQEEIFGPVICVIGYDTIEEAVEIANDTVYGLSGYVSSADAGNANAIAKQLRTGMVHVNGAGLDLATPFGGYKQSGNGREFAKYGLHDFLEVKSVYGHNLA